MKTTDRDFPEMPDILVSAEDQKRLLLLAMDALDRAPDVAKELIAEMERAAVVAAVPTSTVRMNSIVTFRSHDAKTRRVQLVYPGQADIGQARISILTPIGAALIGLSTGQSIAWFARDGRMRRLTVLSVEPDHGGPIVDD